MLCLKTIENQKNPPQPTPHSYPPTWGIWYLKATFSYRCMVFSSPCSAVLSVPVPQIRRHSTVPQGSQHHHDICPPAPSPDNISRRGGLSGVHNIRKKYGKITVSRFLNLFSVLKLFIASQRPRRPPETFLEPVASFSQSISPWRSMATPFIPKMISFVRTCTSQITHFPKPDLN